MKVEETEEKAEFSGDELVCIIAPILNFFLDMVRYMQDIQ